MKPIKPKFSEAVQVNWKISKYSQRIISEYASYTKYSEDELVDRAIAEFMDDDNFRLWLKSKRNNKRSSELLEKYEDFKKRTSESFLDFLVEEDDVL